MVQPCNLTVVPRLALQTWIFHHEKIFVCNIIPFEPLHALYAECQFRFFSNFCLYTIYHLSGSILSKLPLHMIRHHQPALFDMHDIFSNFLDPFNYFNMFPYMQTWSVVHLQIGGHLSCWSFGWSTCSICCGLLMCYHAD